MHFNDASATSIGILKKNLIRLKDEPTCKVTNLDFSVCLARAGRFDLIFIDPPYRLEAGVQALKIIEEKSLLNDGGVAVLERDRSFSGEINGLNVTDERKYGKTYLTFFEKV